MNMKKTIAAIAAGAVVVSAMATTVSAFDAQTLHYNLVATTTNYDAGSVTLSYRVSNIGAFDVTKDYKITLVDGTGSIKDDNLTVTLKGTYESGQSFTHVLSTNKEAENYSPAIVKAAAVAGTSPFVATIDVAKVVTNLKSGSDVYISFTVKHNGDKDSNISYINNNLLLAPTTTLQATVPAAKISMDFGTGYSTGGAVDSYVAGAVVPLASVYTAATKNEVRKPFKTSYNNSSTTYNAYTNILEYLQTANVATTTKPYANVVAVVNDAIANYDSVTFTFNTATGKVFDAESAEKAPDDWAKTALLDTYNDWYKTSTDKYMAFGQGTYGLYGYDASTYTGYTGYDFSYMNLFSGALIFNNYYTMSLSDVTAFDYAAKSLSFNWEDVMATNSGSSINPYVTYLSSMQLATSVVWYWDSLDIVLANNEVEDIDLDTGAGADADADVIEDDEIVEEEIVEEIDEEIDEEYEEEVDFEEEEEEVEVEVEVEPTPAPAANPKTGNASVALAVIPVALAAAAIVAKKRG